MHYENAQRPRCRQCCGRSCHGRGKSMRKRVRRDGPAAVARANGLAWAHRRRWAAGDGCQWLDRARVPPVGRAPRDDVQQLPVSVHRPSHIGHKADMCVCIMNIANGPPRQRRAAGGAAAIGCLYDGCSDPAWVQVSLSERNARSRVRCNIPDFYPCSAGPVARCAAASSSLPGVRSARSMAGDVTIDTTTAPAP